MERISGPVIAAGKRKRTRGPGSLSGGGLAAGQGWAEVPGEGGGAGQTPCHSALGTPVVPSMDVALLGGAGSLGGRALMQKSLQILGCQALGGGSPQPLRRENGFWAVGTTARDVFKRGL